MCRTLPRALIFSTFLPTCANAGLFLYLYCSFSVCNSAVLTQFVILFLLCTTDSNKYRIKGDYLDVPVRAGYRIVGDDKDGFLEDGIIVKTKGTGYIDQRYRNRRFENQPVSQASYQKYFYSPQPVASSLMYPKYAVPEIIYGRRGKLNHIFKPKQI